jgi:hypothetical protein
MSEYYWELLKQAPNLLKDSILTVEGSLMGFAFIVLLFNRRLGKKLLEWDGISRWWALIPIVGLFTLLMGRVNYENYEYLNSINKKQTEQIANVLALLNAPSIDAKAVELPETDTMVRVTTGENNVLIEFALRVENTGDVPVVFFSPDPHTGDMVQLIMRPAQMWLDKRQHDLMRVQAYVQPMNAAKRFQQTPEQFAAGIRDGTRRFTFGLPLNFFSAIKPDAAFRLFLEYGINVDRLELYEKVHSALKVESVQCSDKPQAKPKPLMPEAEGPFYDCSVEENAERPMEVILP